MSQETQGIVSLVIACLAFLVSGITLGWTIFRDVLDKGRLNARLMIGRLIPGVAGAPPVFISSHLHAERVPAGEATHNGIDQIVVTITNVGRRPIVATKLGGRQSPEETGKKGFVIGSRQLPKTLQPGEFTMEWFDNPDLLAGRVKGIFIADSTGTEWRVSRRNFQATKADAKRFMGRPAGQVAGQRRKT